MKVNFSCAALVAFAVAIANVPAYAGLFDCCLFKNNEKSVSEKVAFYDDQSLTFGDMNASLSSNYAFCNVDGFYGECASCAGASETTGFSGTIVDGGIPAAISYESYPTYGACPTYDCQTFGYSTCVQPRREGCLSRLCKRIKGMFGKRCCLCQPAYVCDPCWSFCETSCAPACSSVCDPCWTPCAPACDPCGVSACDPCGYVGYNAGAVFAPRSCCGDGFYPGEVNELDPVTGKAVVEGGIDAQTPNVAPKQAPNSAVPNYTLIPNSTLRTEPEQPAVPAMKQQFDDPQVPAYEQNDGSELETVPTPQANPNLGAGILRMLVPEDSVVYVNGYRTKQQGEVRTFAANNLEVGETYTFEVRVVALRNGEIYEDVQTATLTAGSNAALAFNLTLKENQAYAMDK